MFCCLVRQLTISGRGRSQVIYKTHCVNVESSSGSTLICHSVRVHRAHSAFSIQPCNLYAEGRNGHRIYKVLPTCSAGQNVGEYLNLVKNA